MGNCGGPTTTVALSPNACSAAQVDSAGRLLVPKTALVGLAPGGNSGTERSVDVDVVNTPGCPDVWTVGARLSPVFGQVNSTSSLDLAAAGNQVWQAVPGSQMTLPQAGTYEVSYSAAGESYIAGPSGGGQRVFGRLFNETAGTVVGASETLVVGVATTMTNSNVASYGQASKSVFMTVAGLTTLRLEGMRHTTDGTPQTFTGIDGDRTTLWFKKVAD